MCVKDLHKVATYQWNGQKSDSRPIEYMRLNHCTIKLEFHGTDTDTDTDTDFRDARIV